MLLLLLQQSIELDGTSRELSASLEEHGTKASLGLAMTVNNQYKQSALKVYFNGFSN
jgi:hypothetical protein